MVEDRTSLAFPHAGRTSVPLCTPDDLVCCVAAGPGGHALRVLLDTGTDPSAIDARLAHRLGLSTGGSGLGIGAVADDVPFTEAVLPWLRIGDLGIRDLFAPALDLSGLPFAVDIVLGYNVLRQLALRIDYRRRALELAHPDLGAAPEAPALTLPLLFYEHFPALAAIEVAGQPIALATIDTGSNAALTVGPDLADTLGIAPGAADQRLGSGAGFGGGRAVLRGRRLPVQVGGHALADVEIDAPQAPRGDLGRPGRANIGNRLLARFASVAIDYQREQICFEL